ncbi:piggyBac transposable element-derived protein 4-like [Melitaea cinxia]|uniref:piggyBac transposable element-derived protein 4-like n=1 Tax=Melitaea cinxia TaxID=113334 RepID=UPI001E274356|nr:piggyBac transposable element-derived protein 4-like [Melitaea cinxia]
MPINYNMTDSDIEDQLFRDDSSDEEYNFEDLDFSSDDEEEAADQRLIQQNAAMDLVPLSQLPSPSEALQPPESAAACTVGWTSTCELRNIDFTKQNAFFGNPGTTPISFFNFFFENDFLSMICERTNAQAAKLLENNTTLKNSRINYWKELNIPELRIFLGLLFHMGFIQLSRLQDYWKTNRLFSIPVFGQYMSRNRYLLIMRCLHFSSETGNETDPLFKIRSMIDYFNNKMDSCYYPAKELSLDESMVLWRGRLKFRQYIKNKRHKYGIKLYMLTEPDGLILKFRVYAGNQDIEVAGKGHAQKVVMQLMEKYLENGHSLYMDNYYNSFRLAKCLLEHKTYCTGTLRKDLKENPREVYQEKLKKGFNISRFQENVHIGKWKDKRPLMYITTEYTDRMVPVANKRGQISEKPEAIAKYNEFMSGVDRQDQLLAFYPCERKTLRWYLKLAIHTFQLLFLNSYKMYNKYSGKPKMTLYDYRLSVINELLPEKNTTVVAGSSRARNSREVLHKISKITERNSKGFVKRKMCRMCSKAQKKRKDSMWHCEMCHDKPGLCFECFDEYHLSI